MVSKSCPTQPQRGGIGCAAAGAGTANVETKREAAMTDVRAMRVHVVSGMWPVHTLCLTPDSDASRGLYLASLAWIAECHVKYLSPGHLHLHLSIWAFGHLLFEHSHSAHAQSEH